jgi:hypothetical protein
MASPETGTDASKGGAKMPTNGIFSRISPHLAGEHIPSTRTDQAQNSDDTTFGAVVSSNHPAESPLKPV